MSNHGSRRTAPAALLLIGVLVVTAGCTGADDATADQKSTAPSAAAEDGALLEETGGLFHGAYVGKAARSQALIAIAAAPPMKGAETREVTLFVSDGERLSEFFPGIESGNAFRATSTDGDAKVFGVIDADRVKGRVRLPGGESFAFTASRAAGAAGLYGLQVSGRGELSGATEAGVGASGSASLKGPGSGHLDLADGRRLRFAVRSSTSGGIPEGTARVIVLPDGRMAGVLHSDGRTVTLTSRPG